MNSAAVVQTVDTKDKELWTQVWKAINESNSEKLESLLKMVDFEVERAITALDRASTILSKTYGETSNNQAKKVFDLLENWFNKNLETPASPLI